MQLNKVVFLLFFFGYGFFGLFQPALAQGGPVQEPSRPIDEEATRKTRNLYSNLQTLAKEGTLFGQHEAMAYGVGWKGEKGRSDVKEISGSYPAVHGWDLGKIGTKNSINGVPFKEVRRYIRKVYRRGGINTVAWHMDNLLSGGNSWDTTYAIKDLLPGGKAHAAYLDKLDLAAKFFKRCRANFFTPIPIIFRPFHEHNGDWFWWGKGFTSEEEFIQLWQFTVDYLREEKNVHNLLYAFSPDRSRLDLENGKEAYLYGYPGDAYVDIIGLDDYWDMGFEGNIKPLAEQKADLISSLKLIHELAKEKGKLAALTETGLDKLTTPDWYTAHLLSAMKAELEPLQISYVMVWRNAHTGHHYSPYSGHPAEQDFRQFCQDKRILLEDDVQNMYRRNKLLLSSRKSRQQMRQ